MVMFGVYVGHRLHRVRVGPQLFLTALRVAALTLAKRRWWYPGGRAKCETVCTAKDRLFGICCVLVAVQAEVRYAPSQALHGTCERPACGCGGSEGITELCRSCSPTWRAGCARSGPSVRAGGSRDRQPSHVARGCATGIPDGRARLSQQGRPRRDHGKRVARPAGRWHDR